MSHTDFQSYMYDVESDVERNWALHRTIMAAPCMITYHDGRFNVWSKCDYLLFIDFLSIMIGNLPMTMPRIFTHIH